MIIDCFQNQNLKNFQMSCLVTAVLEITECFSGSRDENRTEEEDKKRRGNTGGSVRSRTGAVIKHDH